MKPKSKFNIPYSKFWPAALLAVLVLTFVPAPAKAAAAVLALGIVPALSSKAGNQKTAETAAFYDVQRGAFLTLACQLFPVYQIQKFCQALDPRGIEPLDILLTSKRPHHAGPRTDSL